MAGQRTVVSTATIILSLVDEFFQRGKKALHSLVPIYITRDEWESIFVASENF